MKPNDQPRMGARAAARHHDVIEGKTQIEALLQRRSDVVIDPISAEELPHGLTPHPRGWLRTLPGDIEAQGGVDGFFMVRLVKRA